MSVVQLNVFDEPLELCSNDPLTGFMRNGCCSSHEKDHGEHLVCSSVTEKFLKFSLGKGNDLITPNPSFDFKGLRPGDKWCLCTSRWIESLKNDVAPKVYLKSTNKLVLEKINLVILKKFAIEVN
tara:strand:+ start:121 stop:495 length:375 start_codon:yes stop_codon:yes gene_type:complete